MDSAARTHVGDVAAFPPPDKARDDRPVAAPAPAVEGPPRRRQSGQFPALPPVSPSAAAGRAAARRSAQVAVKKPAPDSAQLWPFWVVLATLAGVALRMVPLHEGLLPVFVGIAVTAGVVLLLWLVLGRQEQARQRAATRRSTPAPGKPSGPVASRSNPASRLSGLVRRSKHSGRRDLRGK
jgi:hypothetical protein